MAAIAGIYIPLRLHGETRKHNKMELVVETDRGFVEASALATEANILGIIPIESIYSPILKVKYTIDQTFPENTHKTLLEITTVSM